MSAVLWAVAGQGEQTVKAQTTMVSQ